MGSISKIPAQQPIPTNQQLKNGYLCKQRFAFNLRLYYMYSFLTVSNWPDYELIDSGNFEKLEGYRMGLARGGIAYDPRLLVDPGGHSAAEAHATVAAFLARRGARPTALLASNDLLAFGALRACRDRGVAVPGDLAVVGFDDIEASDYAPVPLTTVHYGADELSKAAVDRLLELINAPGRLPRPKQTFIEPKLVVRESCGMSGGGRRRRRRGAVR